MAENPIQGFQTDTGVEQYDYNALANKPTLITQKEINAAITAANKYTDEQINQIFSAIQAELDKQKKEFQKDTKKGKKRFEL